MRKTATTFSIKHFSSTNQNLKQPFYGYLLVVVSRLSDCLRDILFFITSTEHQYTYVRVITSTEKSESIPVHRCQNDHQYPNVRVITSRQMSDIRIKSVHSTTTNFSIKHFCPPTLKAQSSHLIGTCWLFVVCPSVCNFFFFMTST